MSSDLVWQIIRNNSSFIRRQRGIKKHFSVEKFNLKKTNSPRYNGLINEKAMDIAPAADGKGVVITTKKTGKGLFPRQQTRTIALTNVNKAVASVGNIAKSHNLRTKAKLAQTRASVFLRSQQPKSKKYAKKVQA